jgi:hypothetical protein
MRLRKTKEMETRTNFSLVLKLIRPISLLCKGSTLILPQIRGINLPAQAPKSQSATISEIMQRHSIKAIPKK